MSTTRIEEKNDEARNKPLVLDSGATAHYYPTAFDEESPNDSRSQDNQIIIANGSEVCSRSQGNSEIVIAEFKNDLSEALLSAGTLVQQQEHPADLLTQRITSNGRITQICARTMSHIRPKLPSPTRLRLSAAGNVIRTVDISSNYLYLPIDPPIAELPAAVRQHIGRETYSRNYTYCHTHGNEGTGRSHNANQCGNESARRRTW